MARDPKSYLIDGEVLAMVWAALYDGANDELASVVRDTMIAQGCQELHGDYRSWINFNVLEKHLEDKRSC
jgi:hypothetical protein